MPIHYDITTDGLFLEGVRTTEKKMEKKMEQEKLNMMKKMLRDGLPIKTISDYLNVTQKFVKQIQKELGEN